MTQEEKQLLLQDLCARLPYNCRVFYEYIDDLDGKTYGYSLTLNTWCIDEFVANKAVIKPYLRPMSSMTEEERIEFSKLLVKRYCEEDWEGHISTSYCIEIDNVYTDDENGIKYPSAFSMDAIDWLNAHHFDYRGLIERGLAIAVNKNNDPYK